MLTRPPACAASNIKSLTYTEPLLFLYPRWFQQQCRASVRGSRTGRPFSTDYQTKPRLAGWPTNLRPPERWLHTPTSSQGDSAEALQPPKPRKVLHEIERDAKTELDRWFGRTITAPDSTPKRARRRFLKASPTCFRKVSQASPWIRRLVQRKYAAQTDRGFREQLAHRDVHRIINPLAAASANVHGQPPSRETVEVPANVLRAIAGTAKPNMWIHHGGSGCAVHVLPSAIADSDYRRVELIGAPVSIAAARDYLLSYKIGHNYNPLPYNMADEWDRILHVDDIPRPQQWSVYSFYRYVSAVLSHKPRPSQGRSIYGPERYATTASQLLQSLFSSAQDSSAYASVAALRLVLNFHRLHQELRNSVSSFWHSAIVLGLAPDVDCFNQELARLISVQKVEAAVQLLFDMRKANVSPDTDTWRIVLSRAENDLAQQKILGALRMLGLLDTTSEQAKASTALARKVGPYFDSHLDSIDELAEYMEHHIGSEWLSTSTLNRLLRTCLISTGPVRFNSALIILNKSQQSGHGQSLIDANTVSLLVRILAKAGLMDDAFSLLLTSVHLRHTRKHDIQIIAALFDLALRKKFINSAKVLWCYAATRANMTYRTQSKMRAYLKYNDSRREFEIWRNLAASFIVGHEIDTRHFERVFPLLLPSASPIDVRIALSKYETDGQRRYEQVQLSRFLISRDLNLWRLYWPMKWDTFQECLGKAIQKDQNQPKPDTISDLTNNVLINIPLRRRKRPIPTNAKVRWDVVNGHVYDRNTFSFVDELAGSADMRVLNDEDVDEQTVEEASETDDDASHEMTSAPQLGEVFDIPIVSVNTKVQAVNTEDEGRESQSRVYDSDTGKRESTAAQQ